MKRCLLTLAGIAVVMTSMMLASVTPTVNAATTVVVNPASLVPYTTPPGSPGWYFWNDKNDLPTGSPGALVTGPATPPLGTGSVELGPLTDNGATAGGHSVIATNGYSGTALADITSLSYSTYQPGPTLAIAIQFDVQYRPSDFAYGGRLVFEPYQNGAVIVGSGWQTWSPLAGKWWATKTNSAGTGGAQVVPLPAGNCAISTPCTWAQINAAFPAAKILGRFLLKAGSGWSGFDGNADSLTVGVSGVDTIYDFEPSCSTDCYVRTDGDDTNAGTADTPALAKKTIQAAVNTVSPGGTVHVAAGTYQEQVDIGKVITLTGAGAGSTFIKAPASLATMFTTSAPNKPVVYVHATGGTIQQLTVDGDGAGNANYRIEGIAFYNAGGTVDHVDIVGVRETPLSGTQHGVALYANNTDAVARTLTATHMNISDYQKNGMALNGDGLTVDVGNNTVTGAGTTPLTAQNGIQVGFGGAGTVHDNVVSGNDCTNVPGGCTDDPATTTSADGAAGILLYLPGTSTITVDHNTLTGNQFGIWSVGATALDINHNGITGGRNGVTVFDCDVSCGAGDAVGTTGTINSNTLSGQTYGLLIRNFDPGAPAPSMAAHQNSITGSSIDGAWADVALNATDNWWGSSSGPRHASNTYNVPLQGVNVTNNVTFVPWLNAAPPVGVSFAPVTDTSPVGSFSSIQAGVNASNPGGTVNAAAGTFTENVTIGNEVTIAGAGQASTFVIPATSAPNPCAGSSLCGGLASNIMLVQANNVTVHDLTLDGDNPALVSGLVVGGADLDARNGIITNHSLSITYNNLTVHHVTVKNIYLRGIYASSGGTFNFHHDTVQNVQGEAASIGMFNFGGSGTFANNNVSATNDAISSNHSSGTQFLNNVITTSASGVHTDNAGDGGGSADLLDGNVVTNCTAFGFGVWTFVPYIQPTVRRNLVTNCSVGLAATGSFVPVGTLFQDNEVDGALAAGSTGVYITTNLFGFGSGDVSATLTGNIIKNNQDGILYESEPGYTLTVNNLGNAISGNTGTGASTTGGGTFSVKMTGDWWGSATGPTHALNPGGTGNSVANGIPYSPWLGIGTDSSAAPGFQMASPMTWVAGQNVCDVTCIQKAVDYASPGDTINVLAGTFNEQVQDLGKSNLLINGAGMGSTFVRPSGVVANTTRLNTSAAAPIFDIENAAGVNIQNLTADGSLNGISGCAPHLLGFYYKKASGNLTNVAASHIKLSPSLIGCQTGVGVFVEADSPDVANVQVSNAQITDYQKGGVVGNRTGTTIGVSGSTVTGIGPTPQIAQNGIQVGFGATGTLTGNNVSGNDYTPNTDSATGILLFQAALATVSGNNIHDNMEGLFVDSTSGVIVSGNLFSGTRDTALFANLSNGGTYTGNTINGQPGSTGIYVFDTSSNNSVSGNAIRSNDHGIIVDFTAGPPAGNHFNNNCLAGNIGAGVFTTGTLVGPKVDAKTNWWGEVDGPNPPGHGDAIIPGNGSTIDPSGYLMSPVAGCPDPGDFDGDGLSDVSEANVYLTDWRNPDTDGDNCGDGKEVGPNQMLGGDRDPLSPWDFFDVPAPAGPATGADGKLILTAASVRNKTILLSDVAVILSYVGRTSSNPAYMQDNNNDGMADGQQLDRTPSTNPAKLWRSGPPNGVITLQDAAVAIVQVGANCN